MKETWRWFGPVDKISLPEINQTGAKGIVTALHDIPYGEIWQPDTIAERRGMIESAGMKWDVVESLPVHENIKRGEGDLSVFFANYRQSMANLAAQGITTICYNFMPLLDWTRTQLNAPAKGGGTALRFDMTQCAAFDLFMLRRETDEYPEAVVRRAEKWFHSSSDKDRETLTHSIMAGLPGAYKRYDVVELKETLAKWAGFTADDLRASLSQFFAQVIPTADELGMRFCIHPDDPPRHLFGLPRIVSSQADLATIFNLQQSLSNGLTLCSGSLGANPENDVPAIAKMFKDRIHFAHLRNVTTEPDGSFQEASHLEGDTNLPAVINILLQEQKRRQKEGRDDSVIPFRPDHGHELLNDGERAAHPGYPLIGRMRGLAELRGVIAGLNYSSQTI